MTRIRAQVRAEISLVVRNGEQILLTLAIPAGLLVFFSVVDVAPGRGADTPGFLLPGIVALAVMSSAMTSLGIATGFERSYLVLKRLGATPLRRGELIAAKAVTVAVLQTVQLGLLVPLGMALGWEPTTRAALALPALVAGTLAFAGIGLALAGRLRAEVNLAALNGLFLAGVLFGGMVIPFGSLPAPLAGAAPWFPPGALADVLRDALGSGAVSPARSWVVLVAWAAASPAAAARLFRWS